MILGPRVVVAGVSSGVGKTTVATGVMAALRARGLAVASAKVGPDFIDPGYHALATGRPGRNLDSWICGEEAIGPLAGRASAGADVLIVEGVMGLFDGAGGEGPDASTASVARLIEAPVVLVVDAWGIGRSVAAVVHGFASLHDDARIAGIVFNRVGSDAHAQLLREAVEPLGIPVLGALPRDVAMAWRDRHLGLVPVAEHPDEIRRTLDRLAAVVAGAVDLDGLLAVARTAPTRPVADPVLPEPVGRARLAVAGGPAFTFVYRDNIEAMEAAGAEVAPFDPRHARQLPEDCDALYVGGGFPEVYAAELGENRPLLDDVRSRLEAGMPVWAECGGLLWLGRSLDGVDLVGAVPTTASMTDRLTLGYRMATATSHSPVAAAGDELRGHEFHYSATDPSGRALQMRGRLGTTEEGFSSPTLFASYLHLHLGGDPRPAARFVDAACRTTDSAR
ncbi:MAG: cobyrinate a,c-diamide synthase [Acidimicrobiales bacterium]